MGPFSQLSSLLCRPSWTHTYTHVHTHSSPPLCNLGQKSQKALQCLHGPEMETEAPPREELAQDLWQRLPAKASFYKWVKRGPEREVTCPRSHSELEAQINQIGVLSQSRGAFQASEGVSGTLPPWGGEGTVRHHPALTAHWVSVGLRPEARHPLLRSPEWLGRGGPTGTGASRLGPPAGTCCSPGLAWSPLVSEGLAGRPSPHRVCSLRPPLGLPHSRTPPHTQRDTPPAALARPASAITRFPALGRSHTPPTALIGSLLLPPGTSGLSIGLSGMSVKSYANDVLKGTVPGAPPKLLPQSE